MYLAIPQGKSINIQGLECQLAPEGYVYNILTKKVEHRGVYERSPKKEEQYWERFQYPAWYKNVQKAWDEYDKKRKEDDEEFYDEKLEKYKAQEWDRRLNGFWFRNYNPQTGESEAVYLTGMNYMYLQWWSIDVGYPKFRMPDLEKFYFMQYCIEDPLCMGGVEVTKRRFGKSFVAGLFATEYTSRTKMSFSGIQSKTGKDASKFFSKTVVNPFRRLPKFFRPEYDMSLGVNPKSEMRFQKTNIRGKKAESSVDKDELGGGIDHQPSDKVAYDGQKLHRYVADEVGKTVEVDVYERHEVVRYCLLDDEGKVIGKAWYTTTVEKVDSEKDGVQDAFKRLWNASDQTNKGENGMSKSGLYRFFMSAKRTRYFDVYGYPNEEETLKAIMMDRESVKDNSRSLSARIRKEPLTIEEALMDDGDKCVFNIINIIQRENELKEKPVYKRHIIYYRDHETQKVKWRDAQKNEQDFCWAMTSVLPESEANKSIIDNGIKKPSRTTLGAITCDSYSNSQGGRKYGSKASAWIGLKKDALNPDNTGKAIGHLYGRPKEKDDLHKQVLLAGEYWGFQIWYEHVADDYDGYFRDRGRVGYLGLYPLSTIEPTKRNADSLERHRGFPTTPFSLTAQHDAGISYVEHYSHLIDFEPLLESMKKFDPYKRTEFDCVVAFCMLIVCLTEKVHIPVPKKKPIIAVYNSSGERVYA